MNEEEKQYAELQVTSNFSFLRGASHPAELIEAAAALGYSAIAITDRNTFAGIVRAHTAAKKAGIRFIPACRIDLMDGTPLLAYPTNKAAYSSLSNLLSKGNLRTEKGKCQLYKSDLPEYIRDTKLIIVPPDSLNAQFELDDSFIQDAAQYAACFGKNLYLGIRRSYRDTDAKLLHRIRQLSQQLNIPLVATNDVHYHEPGRRELQDVLTCIREKCTIHTAGFKLYPNAERYLKPVAEMHRLFTHYPDALKHTLEIAESAQFSLDELRYEYPHELVPEGYTPLSYLEELSWKGARKYYGENIPDKIQHNIRHELQLIEEMNFAQYFLTVEDIVREARSRGILCQGRGSAANSTICFCLGVTGVDPMQHELLFERFISKARNEPPDIDIDFEHERREEMMQYVYEKYGRDRAAIVATVTEVHYRSA
ncbi:MAG TPA: PHP domain-containing protein, partial [Parasegetibacter sp.]